MILWRLLKGQNPTKGEGIIDKLYTTYFCLTFRIILPDVEIELSPAPSLTSLATPSKQVDVPMETTKGTSIEDKSNDQKRPRESTPPVLEEDEKETRAKLKVGC